MTFIREQNAFHRALEGFLNGRYPTKSERRLALLAPARVRQSCAEALSRRLDAVARASKPTCIRESSVTVPSYAGASPHVLEMMGFLDRHLRSDLVGAFVHGSLGSYEQVPYSDFDALVVLTEDVLRSPVRFDRVARDLQRARRFMLKLDPLQHHGWFVLTTLDLDHYCEAYFPTTLFDYAKSLLPAADPTVHLRVRDSSAETWKSFESVSSAVLAKLNRGGPPRKMYGLKLLLSQFMLLPALYVQVRDGTGVWKRDSFELASGDFEPAQWECMRAVSEIRQEWTQEFSRWRMWLLARPNAASEVLRARYSIPIPDSIKRHLHEDLFLQMAELVSRMQHKARARKAQEVAFH